MAAGRVEIEERILAAATLDDGQCLLALNEIFAGHRSHQSARYLLRHAGREERQSSSGVLVTTGTGASGWARSVNAERRRPLELPGPSEPSLAFFVREPFPSVSTGTSLDGARLSPAEGLEVVSEMNDGGVLFADGIEEDRLEFPFGARARFDVAPDRLRLVRGA